MQELTNEVVSTLKNMTPNKQRRVLTLFQAKLADATTRPEGPVFLSSPCHAWILPEDDFQRVPKQRTPTQEQQRVAPSAEQRVGTTPDIPEIQDLRRMSDVPPIMNVPNPTTKQARKSTKWVHRRLTQNNVPGTVPPITPAIPRRPVPTNDAATPVRCSPRLGKTAQRIQATKITKKIPKVRFIPIAGRLRNHNVISQQAMNFLTDEVWNNSPQHFTPANLRPKENAIAANL